MRIDGPKIPQVLENSQSASRAKRPSQESSTSGATVVSLGPVAAKASQAPPDVSEAIRARIDEVRTQLADGKYPIDFDRLTQNILDDELARSGGGA